MDEMLAKLNRIYPNSDYVEISAYNPATWVDREYDSSFDNKAPLNKWRNKPLTYEQAQEVCEKGGRVGWVVPKNFVVIDIDNKDNAQTQEKVEKLLEKFEVKCSFNYTSKGIHILFQDPTGEIKSDSRLKCAINVQIDTRANTTGYIILPCNDPHRKWGVWRDYVEELPYFLKPLGKNTTNSFIGMGDGDGRNDALYRWRLTLESFKKLSKSEIEKSLRIINENLFINPLPNNELFKTVLRDIKDSEEQKETDNKFNKIAESILEKNDIIYHHDEFYRYNGIYYQKMPEIDIERLIHFEVNKNINANGRSEIIKFLSVKSYVKPEEVNNQWHKIACQNGIINLVTGELEQPNKSEINTIAIPWKYETEPEYSPRIDQFMKELTAGDMLKMDFLYQIAGYCLLKKNLFARFVVAQGEGGTGKSTYTNLLQKLVGDQNVSHVALSDFDRDYHIAATIGKLLNIDDDVTDTKGLENTGKFKSITSGDTISVRRIYAPVINYTPFTTCIFSCNKLPRIHDKTTGLYRRMILIQLNSKVEHPDPLFVAKVTPEDMEYFLYKAVQGVKLAISEGRFKITQSEIQLMNMFKRQQSPLEEWLYETQLTKGDLYQQKCLPFYTQFREWCITNGYAKICSNLTFKTEVCQMYGLVLKTMKIDNVPIPQQIFYTDDPNFDKEYMPF